MKSFRIERFARRLRPDPVIGTESNDGEKDQQQQDFLAGIKLAPPVRLCWRP